MATQGSLNRLYYLTEIIKRWQGPISIAIFAPGFDAAFTDAAILKLRNCNEDIRKWVSFHIVYPADFPADIAYANDWSSLSCLEFNDALKNFDSTETADIVYPHNVLRNVARSGVNTEFIFLIDIDLVPNHSIRSDFLEFATAQSLWSNDLNDDMNEKTVYVVPAFEIKLGHSMPSAKKDLLTGVKGGYIRQFHNETCYNCHKSENFNEWKLTQDDKDLNVAFNGVWNPNWEPFYIARRRYVNAA